MELKKALLKAFINGVVAAAVVWVANLGYHYLRGGSPDWTRTAISSGIAFVIFFVGYVIYLRRGRGSSDRT